MTTARVAPTPIHYPDELPIAQRRDELLATISTNQVVVVAGEAGGQAVGIHRAESDSLECVFYRLGRRLGRRMDEAKDAAAEERSRVLRHSLKHLKWIAGKKSWKRVVLHSFTHLGGENAPPDFAVGFFEEAAERLRSSGYEVAITPFGWFCQWEISVLGDSLAKVWKEI